MHNDKPDHAISRDRIVAREIHEVTYWKHCTGATDGQVRQAIAKAGSNPRRIERELKRVTAVAKIERR